MPGIYDQEQILQWKKITEAVKAHGATFYCQLWHTGRVSHSGVFKVLLLLHAGTVWTAATSQCMYIMVCTVEQDKKDKQDKNSNPQLGANMVALDKAAVLK